MFSAKESRKLTFMYLANDVIQNSKKKGPEYGQEFGIHMQKAFEYMSSCDEKTKNSLERLLNIWEERGIYDKLTINEFKRALSKSLFLIRAFRNFFLLSCYLTLCHCFLSFRIRATSQETEKS